MSVNVSAPSPRKKVLLVHPWLKPIGGGEVVAVWILEALRKDYELSVLTWHPVNTADLNRYYGTSLNSSDFTTHLPHWFLRKVIDLGVALDADPWSIQRYSLLMRLAKSLRSRYDVVMTTFNEADLGGPAIQYVHYPWIPSLHNTFQVGLNGSPTKRFQLGLPVRFRPWRMISGFSFERMKQNVTLVNSNWTGQAVQRFFKISAQTVYPPIPGVSSLCPWGEKENGFVCIGRLIPDKRIEHIIEILSQVRGKGEDVHLHIIGKSQPEHVQYLDDLRNRVHKAGGWISLHEDLSRKELLNLIAKHRFGIHGMPDEPFGIAVAEMIRAGCVVFTPWAGGQVEITGGDDRLHFSSVEEGAEKIAALLRSPKDLAEVRESLAAQKKLFSTEKFVQDIRQVVAAFQEETR